MTRAFRSALASVAVTLSLVASPSQARDFTSADVLVLVNRDAHNWIFNADSFRLDIETLRLPRGAGEQGKVCGAMVPMNRDTGTRAFQSYSATLRIEGDKLVVSGISPFFMKLDELIAAEMCR
ncbi:MAG: hypothetical protein J0I99_18390 [Devosia sp.]|uniref:hypothetical protein n=1 Tax=Devosia sp. TaxID=1871048 RepID=UPI001AD35530|nr:hypothetical protein [Devosia sp.]MBN9317713.1 hypothetical protein [Devosia sp.]